MIKNKYKPYDATELEVLLHKPWEVSDNPYMLYAAYALSSLWDICYPDEVDDEEEVSPDNMWGYAIPKRILDKLQIEIAADFDDAATNRKPIKIWGRSYSIRKICNYEPELLRLIFDFALEHDEYIVTKEGVMNLAKPANDVIHQYETNKEQAKANRTYLRQIIMLAEDDKNNGWNKLTDMEILIYCWALFYNKHQNENWLQFKLEYKDYFYVTEKEAMKCFISKAALRQRPVGMCTFSFEKVDQWNNANNQKSIAKTIQPSDADDFWYDTALKSTFKPTN